MKRNNKVLSETEIKAILHEFDYIFENEVNRQRLPLISDFIAEYYPDLDDFYIFFEHETELKERILQDKLYNNVITEKEYDELEEIAMIKYPEIPADEISNFYIFSHPNNDDNKRLIIKTKS